jgi:hypothetical protein
VRPVALAENVIAEELVDGLWVAVAYPIVPEETVQLPPLIVMDEVE